MEWKTQDIQWLFYNNFVWNVGQSPNPVQLFVTPCTIAHQAPLSMGFSRQEYCSGLPFPSPGDFSDPGIELTSPALAGRFFTTEPTID